MAEDLATLVTSIGRRARAASLALAATTTAAKNEALLRLADAIDAAHAPLLAANQVDLAAAAGHGLAKAQVDRLTLTRSASASWPNPSARWRLCPTRSARSWRTGCVRTGLRIRKVRVPIGVIGIIFEARPNVTIDCAALCLNPAMPPSCAAARRSLPPTWPWRA